MLVANVFVNIPIKSIAKAYTYLVPADLSFVSVGWRVFVPFGKQKVEGFIIETKEMDSREIAAQDYELKAIEAAVDDEPWFSSPMLSVSRWLSEFYLCSLAEMMRLFMPGKSGLKIGIEYQLGCDFEEDKLVLLNLPQYKKVYDYIAKNDAVSKRKIVLALPELKEDIAAILEKLIAYQLVTKNYTASKRDKARLEKYARLCKPLDDDLREELKRKRAQLCAVEILAASENKILAVKALNEQKVSLLTLKKLADSNIIEIFSKRVFRDSYKDLVTAKTDLTLTADQETALAALENARVQKKYQGFLLKGVTGSGKTQVYIEIARRVRLTNRSVIVLVPEIALTGQLVNAFKAYFGSDIVVIHSRLSLAERNDAMLRVRKNEAKIIIGARSALFTPAVNIGLIIMDEEQDTSYKQDKSPRYHARVVAEKLAKFHNALLILGSATPSLESYYKAKNGELTLLNMPHRVGNLPLPRVTCVDMRRELRMGNRHIMSRALQDLITKTLAKNEQLIIMLNRRGYSTFVMCRSCGETIKCPECGLPLTYHQNGKLSCHHCDMNFKTPDVCPKCGSRYIKYFGSGTEKLETELNTLVPQARVIRMDRDTTVKKFAHKEIIDSFRRHEYDILLGTQMVAKGHDIPNVTAVGIISADSSLNMPDFRAAERTFMLITQTAGRAGRHSSEGQVVIQTYNPAHYAVVNGINQDYEGFFAIEMRLRKDLLYPPYSRLIKLIFQDNDEEKAKNKAAAFIKIFNKAFSGNDTQLAIGPSPAIIAKYRSSYRFVVLIKTSDILKTEEFLRAENLQLRDDVMIDIDPLSML